MNNDFFTQDNVDNQVEQLTKKQEQLSPESLLIQDLRSVSANDMRVLGRARERLFSLGQLSSVQPDLPQLTSLPPGVVDRSTRARAKRRSVAPIITTIAACLVASVLVGSLLSFFVIKQQLSANNHPSVSATTKQAVPQRSFLYVNHGDAGLYKIDPDSGQIIWHVVPNKYKPSLNSRLLIANSTLLALASEPTTGTTYILSLDASSGKLLKAVAIKPNKTRYSSFSSSVITDDTFYVSVMDGGDQSGKGHVDAFSLKDGSLRWSRPTIGTTTISTPYEGNIYIAEANLFSGERNLSALRTSDGVLQWQVRPDNVPSGTLLIADGKLIVGEYTQGIASNWPGSYSAYDLTTHAQLWRTGVFPCSANQYASTMAGRLYVACSNGMVTAFTMQNGKQLWQKNIGSGVSYITSFQVSGDMLYFSQDDTLAKPDPKTYHLLALSATNGHQRWTQNVDAAVSTPVFSHGLLYYGLSNNKLQTRKAFDGMLIHEYQLGPDPYPAELVLAP